MPEEPGSWLSFSRASILLLREGKMKTGQWQQLAVRQKLRAISCLCAVHGNLNFTACYSVKEITCKGCWVGESDSWETLAVPFHVWCCNPFHSSTVTLTQKKDLNPFLQFMLILLLFLTKHGFKETCSCTSVVNLDKRSSLICTSGQHS